MTLKESRVNFSYRVVKIHGSGPFKRRIMDMGITKNAQISIRGYELSLRKEDAECVEIEPINSQNSAVV